MSLLESTVGEVAAADLDACTFLDSIGFDFAEDSWKTIAAACDAHDVDSSWLETNPGLNAPHLSLAVEEVPVRFGRSLEDFLREPTGTWRWCCRAGYRSTNADEP